MFEVVTCGFRAAPLQALPEHRRVRVLPSPTVEDFYDRAVSALLPGVRADPGATVVLLHDGSAAARHRLEVVRSMFGSSRVLPVGIDLPITARAVIATWTASLAAEGVSPGLVTSALPLLTPLLTVQASSASVAKVDIPEVRLRHHLASWVPGVHVEVLLGRERVLGPRARQLETADVVDHHLVRVGAPDLGRRLGGDEELTRLGGVVETVDLGADDLADGAAWWGTSRYHERCLVPADLAAVTAWVREHTWHRCPQCQDSMAGSCGFCSAQEAYA